jgi:hypothetical protein
MPCNSYPSKEELELEYRFKNDKEYRLKLEKKWKDDDIRHAEIEAKTAKAEKEKLEKELSENPLEKLFFNSPMTVFLCKAMDIVVNNFEYKWVTHDMEWWHKEHKYRDAHNNESLLDKEELAKKLIEFEKKYKVI